MRHRVLGPCCLDHPRLVTLAGILVWPQDNRLFRLLPYNDAVRLAFLQYNLCSPDHGVRMETFDHDAVIKEVIKRDKAHPLVMYHVALY